jgi:prepilin signal peptidase PulO-like enzyme (type II secretory pathway)
MGHGDFKLLAGLGAWFGADYLVALILLSSVVGSIIGGTLLVVGRVAHRDIPIPFGPFLAGAGSGGDGLRSRGGWSRPCRSPSRSRTLAR